MLLPVASEKVKVPQTTKPFQGLKQVRNLNSAPDAGVPQTTKPFQGLKQGIREMVVNSGNVPQTTKPFQGLKPNSLSLQLRPWVCRFHKPPNPFRD